MDCAERWGGDEEIGCQFVFACFNRDYEFCGVYRKRNFGDVKNRMTYYTSNDSDDFCDLIKIYNNYCLQLLPAKL